MRYQHLYTVVYNEDGEYVDTVYPARGLRDTTSIETTCAEGRLCGLAETVQQPTLKVDIEVEGNLVPAAVAGHFTFPRPDGCAGARKYYTYAHERPDPKSDIPTELIAVTAVPHEGFEFVRWKGTGPVFDASGQIRTDVSLAAPDDDSERWVTDETIYLKCLAQGEGGEPATSSDREVKAVMDLTEVEIVLTFDDGPMGYFRYAMVEEGGKMVFKTDESGNYFPLNEDMEEMGPMPYPPRTRSILNILAEEHAKAVFFVTANREVGPNGGGSWYGLQLLKEMKAEGHRVEIHTAGKMQHVLNEHIVRKNDTSDIYPVGEKGEVGYGEIPSGAATALDCDLEAGKRRLAREGGIQARYVRPVGGAYDEGVLKVYERRGLDLFLAENGKQWDGVVDTNPFNYEEAIVAAIQEAQNTNVERISLCLLMHDTNTWGSALESVISNIKETIRNNKGRLVGFVLPGEEDE